MDDMIKMEYRMSNGEVRGVFAHLGHYNYDLDVLKAELCDVKRGKVVNRVDEILLFEFVD